MHVFPLFGDLPEGFRVTISPYRRSKAVPIPFFESIPAGFPSPAEDYLDACLDLNDLVVKHPAATFFVRVNGDSMVDAGIDSGDVLVVDRALDPEDEAIVIAVINGDFTVKRISRHNGKLYLVPANLEIDPIEITEEMDFQVWGVVTYAIHRFG